MDGFAWLIFGIVMVIGAVALISTCSEDHKLVKGKKDQDDRDLKDLHERMRKSEIAEMEYEREQRRIRKEMSIAHMASLEAECVKYIEECRKAVLCFSPPFRVTDCGKFIDFTDIQLLVPIAFIDGINVTRVGREPVVTFSRYGSPSEVDKGDATITISMVSGTKHKIKVVYTCTDLMYAALTTVWKNS